MTDEEYLQTQNKVMLLVGMILELPLKEFIERLEYVQVFGSLLDPTLYREAGEKLRIVQSHARTLRDAQLEFIKATAAHA
jgi:hypothetical protein